jgi:hypothetical protein
MQKAWFRHKSIGYGVTPLTWEGWLCVLALVAAIASTLILLGAPPLAKPTSAAEIMQLRAHLGLGGVNVPYAVRIIIVGAEVIAFMAFARTRTAPDLP